MEADDVGLTSISAENALFCYREEMLQENSSAVFQLESLGSPKG